MALHSENITLEKIGKVWRVCSGRVCREHVQKWQALVFYHQMINSSSAGVNGLDLESPNEQNL